MAANRANSPRVGSPTANPPIVANTIKLAATVALIMFSILMPFCVWYVYYGSALQVLMIYKDFVIVLLFVDSPGD